MLSDFEHFLLGFAGEQPHGTVIRVLRVPKDTIVLAKQNVDVVVNERHFIVRLNDSSQHIVHKTVDFFPRAIVCKLHSSLSVLIGHILGNIGSRVAEHNSEDVRIDFTFPGKVSNLLHQMLQSPSQLPARLEIPLAVVQHELRFIPGYIRQGFLHIDESLCVSVTGTDSSHHCVDVLRLLCPLERRIYGKSCNDILQIGIACDQLVIPSHDEDGRRMLRK